MEFVRQAWHIVEPTEPFVHGWHLDMIAVHLEAVSRGEITRLLVNVPPGTMKSLLISVFWPAWEWGPIGKPATKYMTAAYEIDLAERDARKMRLLLESDWFQKRWPIRLADDQNEKTKFENANRGFRLARSIQSLTGERADRLIIDDPHSIKTAESDAQRKTSVRNFREAAQSRLNSAERSAIIVVMQRIHEGDISGEIIEKIGGYVEVILPMEFDPKRRCVTPYYADPRTEPMELLFPQRYPQWTIDRDKPIYGEYAWAGQMDQRPTPRDAGFFMVDRIQEVAFAPVCTSWVRGWDFAGTKRNTSAFTAGVLIGKCDAGYVVADVIRVKRTPAEVRKLVRLTAENDGSHIRIRAPQDPGQAGVAQKDDYAKVLEGFTFKFVLPSGDKQTRAEPFASQMEAGRVMMVKAPWNDAYKEELRMVPSGRFWDQTDASADAFNELNTAKPLPGASASY